MKFIRIVTAVLLSGTLAAGAAAKDLVVLCAGAVKPVLSVLEPAWVARSGHKLQVTMRRPASCAPRSPPARRPTS
jgi:hypothetical protein